MNLEGKNLSSLEALHVKEEGNFSGSWLSHIMTGQGELNFHYVVFVVITQQFGILPSDF